MKQIVLKLSLLTTICFIMSCKKDIPDKGFVVEEKTDLSESKNDGLKKDYSKFLTAPGEVLLTQNSNFRLNTIFKINFNKDSVIYLGENNYIYNYEVFENPKLNNWHDNYLPGFEVVYGYNLVNISINDIAKKEISNFFVTPVLIRNFYFPTSKSDTLNGSVVKRNFFMVSVHDEDTNKDGMIDKKDLRRFYSFNEFGKDKKAITPTDFSVFKSQYDLVNDIFFVYGKKDSNKNGQIDKFEPINIFWIDLKDRNKVELQF